jgi:hypothetical protein
LYIFSWFGYFASALAQQADNLSSKVRYDLSERPSAHQWRTAMDMLFPYLTRLSSQPTVTAKRLISPVMKYQRIVPEPDPDKPFRVGWQHWQHQLLLDKAVASKQQTDGQDRQPQHPQQEASTQPETTATNAITEHPWLATGHAVTPEQDQHPDAAGHLDIYI